MAFITISFASTVFAVSDDVAAAGDAVDAADGAAVANGVDADNAAVVAEPIIGIANKDNDPA